jgi:hypothetical protein
MDNRLLRSNLKFARSLWKSDLNQSALQLLKALTHQYQFSIAEGDLIWLERGWYATHTGLIRLASRKRCAGIHCKAIATFCDPQAQHWAFEATVYKTKACRGFVGYGDADPSNVSFVVQGAEMRVAETRAVNRALRKAYGIGICSVEELGTFNCQTDPTESRKASQPTNGNGFGGRTVRDHLCQIIRQHGLDPNLVKAYATDFTGAKELREATREQVQNFVAHLADSAEKNRDALLCTLNSYSAPKEGVA